MKEPTFWGEVSFTVHLDDDGAIELVLDGREYTFNCALSPLSAFRLGQALVRQARQHGLPEGLVDPFV